MFRFLNRICLMLSAVGLVCVPVQVEGGPGCPPARWARIVELSREAKVCLDDGRLDESLAKLRQAYSICAEPKLHRSMGLVLEKAGRSDDAAAAFTACVNEVSDQTVVAECREHLEAIDVASAESEVTEQSDVGSIVESGKEPVLTTTGKSVSASNPKAVGNWVGIALGVVATGIGTGFLIKYGMDRADYQGVHYDPELDGWWDADKLGSRNLAIGVSFTVAGVTAAVLSAALWPKSRVKAAACPTRGGGLVALTVGM